MAMAVHDRHQIHAARLHPDINSIGAPNPIWPNVRQITSQVGIDFMHRVLLTDIGLVVDWHQLRQEHKASKMLAPAFVILLLPLPKWLYRVVPVSHSCSFCFDKQGVFPREAKCFRRWCRRCLYIVR